MQIITIDDQDFSALLQALRDAKKVGKYWRQGQMQVVCATRQFVLVSAHSSPDKIAIRPARTLDEAETLALELLKKEEQKGNHIELDEGFKNGSPDSLN